MKSFFFILSFLLYFTIGFCQLPFGGSAPNFTVQDIGGGSHTLYNKLAGGRSAILDFSATWCNPCWNLHESGVLKSVHSSLGGYTSVLFMESDLNTNVDCLYGLSTCSGSGTWGNWVAGTNYPMANLTSSNGSAILGLYQIGYYPTVYIISPDKRAWEISNFDFGYIESWVKYSFALKTNPVVTNSPCGDNGSIILNTSGGHSTLNYVWSNGESTPNLENIGGGTYRVTITDANGYFITDGPFTVTGPARRVQASISSQVDNLCFGDAKGDVKTNVAFGTAPYTYEWSNGATTSRISNLEAGLYTLTVSDNVNCITELSAYISQPPILTTQIVPTPEKCDQLDGELRFIAAGGVSPYKYSLSNNFVSTNTFKGLKKSEYFYKILDYNNCLLSGDIFLDGTDKPAINAGSKSSLHCNTDSLLIPATGTDDDPSILYKWTTRNGNILSDPSVMAIYVSKVGTYILNIKNSLTQCSNIDSILIIDERNYPNASITGDTVLNCSVKEVSLHGNSNSNNTILYWTNDFNKRTDTLSEIKAKLNGKYIFHVLDTNTFCESRLEKIVSIDTTPPNIQYEIIDPLNCKNQFSTIDARKSSSGLNYKNQWLSPSNTVIEDTLVLNQLSEEGNYSLSITNLKNTCKTYTNIVLKKDIEKPIAHAGLDKDILKCKENQINLDGNQSSKGNQYQYAWSTPDGTILSGENSLEPIISSKGTYTINVKNIQNYCQNTANVIIGEQDKLAAAFENTIVNFTISLKDLTNGKILNRVWQFGDGTFSAEQNPTHTYNKSGAYQLCLIVENDCNSDTLCKTIIVKEILGLKENNESSSISIFPNPAKGKVNLKLDSNIKSFDLHLMNSLKENILIKKIKNPTENIEIDLTNFPSGIYYILCQTDKTNFIKKILIEN